MCYLVIGHSSAQDKALQEISARHMQDHQVRIAVSPVLQSSISFQGIVHKFKSAHRGRLFVSQLMPVIDIGPGPRMRWVIEQITQIGSDESA